MESFGQTRRTPAPSITGGTKPSAYGVHAHKLLLPAATLSPPERQRRRCRVFNRLLNCYVFTNRKDLRQYRSLPLLLVAYHCFPCTRVVFRRLFEGTAERSQMTADCRRVPTGRGSLQAGGMPGSTCFVVRDDSFSTFTFQEVEKGNTLSLSLALLPVLTPSVTIDSVPESAYVPPSRWPNFVCSRMYVDRLRALILSYLFLSTFSDHCTCKPETLARHLSWPLLWRICG